MAAARRPRWTPARLVERRPESTTARTLLLEAADWPGHLPGQHVDVRLTGDDGYQAVRSYSLAAPADGNRLELGVDPIPTGEVSPYLADILPVGALVEVKGPLGGWFVWHVEQPDPVLLVAGGSGIAPLMAMTRARRAAGSTAPFHLLYSVRGPEDVWYREELRNTTVEHDDVTHAGEPQVPVGGATKPEQPTTRILYTRKAPPGTVRRPGRIGISDLPSGPLAPGTLCFVCGPTAFVEHSSDLLITAGHPAGSIRTERFG
jgi:ferredoxin-NADP reductase